MLNGVQREYQYENGYGASVIKHSGSYGNSRGEGKWELAVTKGGKLCYDTPITNDVIGWLSIAEVNELLEKIQDLPKCN